MGDVVKFPLLTIDLDRVRLEGEKPATVLILPVVKIEREEPTVRWMRGDLDGPFDEGGQPA